MEAATTTQIGMVVGARQRAKTYYMALSSCLAAGCQRLWQWPRRKKPAQRSHTGGNGPSPPSPVVMLVESDIRSDIHGILP